MSSQKSSNTGRKAKTFSVKAQGNSMYPVLQSGDMIEYTHTPFNAIKLNDIILVYTGSVLMTHRVIYKTQRSLITRGDNNVSADPELKKGQVLAKAVRFKRKGVWYGIRDIYLSQSILYLHEIQLLKVNLNQKKIPHVFLKGVLISLGYEGTIPQRIYADCDLLVHRSDYGDIEQLFKKLGYKLYDRVLFDRKKSPQSQPEVSFVKMVSGAQVVFDVHFEPVFLMTQLGGMSLLYPSRLLKQLGDRLIEKKVLKNIKGTTYSLCSAPDQILYLALHIFHHNYTDSIRYQLLLSVIKKSASRRTWKELAVTIQTFKLEGYLYLAFVLLKKYYKIAIPTSFILSIQPSPFKKRISFIFLKRVDVFNSDSRFKAGIERFILIFFLSPEPLWKKLFLFIHPDVLYSGIQVGVITLKTVIRKHILRIV